MTEKEVVKFYALRYSEGSEKWYGPNIFDSARIAAEFGESMCERWINVTYEVKQLMVID